MSFSSFQNVFQVLVGFVQVAFIRLQLKQLLPGKQEVIIKVYMLYKHMFKNRNNLLDKKTEPKSFI